MLKGNENYLKLITSIFDILDQARRYSARSINVVLTATYWDIGRKVIEFEQNGFKRAAYGEELIINLSKDLTTKGNRGFSVQNLERMRLFYLQYPPKKISSTLLRISSTLRINRRENLVNQLGMDMLLKCFSLSWSMYVRLLTVRDDSAREFYEREAVRGGWSVRQLDRQISTQFYERVLLSKNKANMLKKGQCPKKGEKLTPEEEIKDPALLEFLNLKDEYSEKRKA